jgi:hypothetical protein
MVQAVLQGLSLFTPGRSLLFHCKIEKAGIREP